MATSNKALAAVYEGVGLIRIREFDIPDVREDDGLLRIEMAGVCGSDTKHYRRPMASRCAPPLIMGHEIVGHIAKIGPIASARWGLHEGDHVVVDSIAGCGRCAACVSGNYRYCRDSIGYGTKSSCSVPPHLWGGYAQYMYLAPNSLVFKIAPDLSPEAGIAICAVVANGIRWVRTIGQVAVGDAVVIQGVGAQGLAAIIAAREAGARLIVATGLTRDQARFELAREMGAHHLIDIQQEDAIARVREFTGGEMADVVVDVAGSRAAAPMAIELVRPLGTVVTAGLTGGQVSQLVVEKIALKELKFLGCFTHDVKAIVSAIRLVETDKYPVHKLVTHKYPLLEADLAVRVAAGEVEGESPVKVALVPN